MLHLQLLLKVIGIVFIYIDYYQLLWVMRDYLPAQLAPYRAAASCHEHDLSADVAHYLFNVYIYRLAP